MFQIDTGSSMTVINVNDLKNYEIEYLNRVEPSNVRLKTYNNTVIVPLGVLKVIVQWLLLKRVVLRFLVGNG